MFLYKTKRMRDKCFKNQPMFSFKKSILRKISWKTWIGFSWSKQPQREKRTRSTRTVVIVSLLQKWEKVNFKWKCNLNPRAENWFYKQVSLIDLPLHLDWSKNRGTKVFQQKTFLPTFLTLLKMKNRVDSHSITIHSATYLDLLAKS